MAGQHEAMRRALEDILSWERIVHTSNHYYMSTVQSVRADLFAGTSSPAKDQDETCAPEAVKKYVKRMRLTADSVKAMSNQEQE
eukprot:scaffold572967_cov46-Prasinocladus_malaysianus.AAC.1